MTPDVIAQGILLALFRIVFYFGGAILVVWLLLQWADHTGQREIQRNNEDYAKWYAARPPKPTPKISSDMTPVKSRN